MANTGLEVFDDTIQKTNIWLKEITEEIGPDRQRAYQQRHVTGGEIADLRQMLPQDLEPFWRTGAQ